MSDERRAEAAAAAEFGFFRARFLEQSTWTDEQWNTHDAEVAEEQAIAAREKAEESKRKEFQRLISDGFPRRAIQAAEVADETIGASAAMPGTVEGIVILSGAPGSGKTVAATRWAVARGGARFVRASTFASSSRYNHEQRDQWLNSYALVLDDLGAEYQDAKGSFATDLDELVDTFYGNMRTLIITTNLNAADFRSRYGERVTDRLRECGKWINCGSKSLRGGK